MSTKQRGQVANDRSAGFACLGKQSLCLCCKQIALIVRFILFTFLSAVGAGHARDEKYPTLAYWYKLSPGDYNPQIVKVRGNLMTESIVSLIAGSIVIWSILLRLRTLNTYKFIENTQVTVFIFAAFAVGLSMVNIQKTMAIFSLLSRNDTLGFLLLASPALFPILFKVLKGQSFSSAFEWSGSIIMMPIIMFAGIRILDSTFLIGDFSKIAYFIAFAIALGFIHSLLGSIMAGFNIALIIVHFFTQGRFDFDLNTVFSLLEEVGIASSFIKWLIVITSTTLGLHGYVNLEWLREITR